MIGKKTFGSLAFAAALAVLPLAAQAATYDINADFSTAANPNGVWTYGFSTVLGGTLTLYDQTPDTNTWRSSTVQSAGAPANFNNPTNSNIGLLPAHTAAFHPGEQGQFSIYRFTAPNAGAFNLTSMFGAIDFGQTDVHVLHNGVSLFDHAVDTTPANSSVSFNTALALLTGDRIDFAVGFGANNSFNFDSTSINASLTSVAAVPEPSTYALMLGGLGLVGFAARRRKQRGFA